MKITRTVRDAAALYAAISVLFMQLAVACYNCPAEAMIAGVAAGVEITHVADAMPADCMGADPDQPGLCQSHAQKGNQTESKPALPDISPFLAASSFVALAPPQYGDSITPPAFDDLLSRVTGPPIAVRNCCFRI